MRKVLVLSLIVLIFSLGFAGLLEEIQKRGVLRVGQDPGYMPLYGTNEKGERIGFEVDLLKKMAEILGVKIEYVIVNWDGIIPALISGKFDFILAGMTITPERALKVDFSIPYLTIGQTVLYNVRKYHSPPTSDELKKMKNLKIAVQLGTTGEFAARRLFPNAEIMTFETMDQAAYQVALGRADIMVVDSIYAMYMADKYEQLASTGELLTKEELGIAVRKGELEFLQWINTFLRWAKVSGLIDELKEKWNVQAE
ncbi:MAG: ABC transporter substrate-binding protein [Thermotoga sp.]|nr:MAG: ABC transporter substrate-binding protein [Thermotoga sp.]